MLKDTITEKTHVHQALVALGLSENDALLYMIMLKYPKSTVLELQKRTPFTRTMLYHVLNNLIQQGLVTSSKQAWRTVYNLEDPEHLYDLLDQKQKVFEQSKSDIRAIIPELKNTFRLSGSRPNIRMFEGLDQYENALDDILNSKADIIYAYVPSNHFSKPGIEIRKEFVKKRSAKGINLYMLVPDQKTAEQILKINPVDPFREIRISSKGNKQADADLNLYNGRMLYTRFEEREPIATLIEDQPLYQMQEAIFLSLWETSTIFK